MYQIAFNHYGNENLSIRPRTLEDFFLESASWPRVVLYELLQLRGGALVPTKG